MTLPMPSELVPHTGTMCLLDEVLDFDEAHVVAGSRTHLAVDHPLAHAGRLSMAMLCEYGAQAMAVHGGLLAARDGHRAPPGYLVSLRDVRLAAGNLAEVRATLRIEATRLHGDSSGWQYQFVVSANGRTLAAGRAAVLLRK